MFNALIEKVENIAVSSNAPILLVGATGTGKSHLATRVYDLKPRGRLIKGGFAHVNCATLKAEQVAKNQQRRGLGILGI